MIDFDVVTGPAPATCPAVPVLPALAPNPPPGASADRRLGGRAAPSHPARGEKSSE
jgi:hypothetical protein